MILFSRFGKTALAAAILGTFASGLRAEQPAKIPSIDVVLKRNINALGGKKAMSKIKNREALGKIKMPAFGAELPVILRAAAPNHEAMELTLGEAGVVRDVFDGSKGWTETPDGNVIPKKERELINKKTEADFHADLNYKKNYPKIEQLGVQKVADRDVYALKMTPKKGDADTFFFDVKTSMVAGVDSTAEMQNMEVKTRVLFRDYKEVDGVHIPFTIELVEPKFAAFTISIEKIRHNVKQTSGWFKKSK